jgi:Arc/MetJ family transcription regulator
VYGGSVTRTNIDIDDDAVAEVMARYRLHTKREAVNFALNRLRRRPATLDEALALRGAGWEGPSIDELRPPIEEFETATARAIEFTELGER